MLRKLSPKFIEDLKMGKLAPILERVRKDDTLDFQIRNDEIHIYYRGGKLVGVTGTDNYVVSFDTNYFRRTGIEVPTLPSIATLDDAESCVAQFQTLKLAMDFYFGRKQNSEREFQQLLSRENSYSAISNATDYFIVDVEFQSSFGGVSTRFDAMAIKWESTSKARKLIGDYTPSLAILEVKYGDSALTGQAGLIAHMEKAYVCFEDPTFHKVISDTVMKQFEQKRELDLVHFSKNGNSNSVTKLVGRPEFIFVLANHDPASQILLNELNSSSFKIAHKNLSKHADIRFATSSFMGYGLHKEYLLDKAHLLDRLEQMKNENSHS